MIGLECKKKFSLRRKIYNTTWTFVKTYLNAFYKMATNLECWNFFHKLRGKSA